MHNVRYTINKENEENNPKLKFGKQKNFSAWDKIFSAASGNKH